MKLRGVLGDSQLLADIPVADALGHEVEHLTLPGGQVDRRHHEHRGGRRQPDVVEHPKARRHGAQRRQQPLRVGEAGENSAGTPVECFPGEDRVREQGHDRHPRPVPPFQPLEPRPTVLPEVPDLRVGVFPISRELDAAGQRLDEQAPDEGIVGDDGNTERAKGQTIHDHSVGPLTASARAGTVISPSRLARARAARHFLCQATTMRVLVVGNGVAGVTAALRVAAIHPEWTVTLVSGETELPWSRPAAMDLLMGVQSETDLRPWSQAILDGARLHRVFARVDALDIAGRMARLSSGKDLPWDRLLLATGSVPRRLGRPGEDLAGVVQMVSWQDVLGIRSRMAKARRAVVVGGGLIGVELAEVLLSRGIPTTVLVRERGFWGNVLPEEESRLVGEAVTRSGATLQLGDEVDRTEGRDGEAWRVHSALGSVLPADIVGVCVGVEPAVDLARAAGLPVGRGIVVDASLRVPGTDVWAAGDCAELEHRGGRVEQVWYTARAQGELAGRSIAGAHVRHTATPWFNSAKFFDLEFQVYGEVPRPVLDGGASLLWVAADRRRSLRIAHRSGRFVGVLALGIRLRHRLCERWIQEGLPIDQALARLREILFDPELTGTDSMIAWARFHEATG